jgi:hypothetical protein
MKQAAAQSKRASTAQPVTRKPQQASQPQQASTQSQSTRVSKRATRRVFNIKQRSKLNSKWRSKSRRKRRRAANLGLARDSDCKEYRWNIVVQSIDSIHSLALSKLPLHKLNTQGTVGFKLTTVRKLRVVTSVTQNSVLP